MAGNSDSTVNQGLEGEDGTTTMALDDDSEVDMAEGDDEQVEMSEEGDDDETWNPPAELGKGEDDEVEMDLNGEVDAEAATDDEDGADAATEEILDRYRQQPKGNRKPVNKQPRRKASRVVRPRVKGGEMPEFLRSLADSETDPVKRAALSYHADKAMDGDVSEELADVGKALPEGDVDEELEEVGKAAGDGDIDEELEDVQKSEGDLEEELEDVGKGANGQVRKGVKAPFKVAKDDLSGSPGYEYAVESADGVQVCRHLPEHKARYLSDALNRFKDQPDKWSAIIANNKAAPKARIVPKALQNEFNGILKLLQRTGYRG